MEKNGFQINCHLMIIYVNIRIFQEYFYLKEQRY